MDSKVELRGVEVVGHMYIFSMELYFSVHQSP